MKLQQIMVIIFGLLMMDEVKTSEVISSRNDDYMKSKHPDTIYQGRLVKWLRYVRYDYPPSNIHKFYLPTTFKNNNDIQILENFTLRHPIEEKVKTKTLPPINMQKNKNVLLVQD